MGTLGELPDPDARTAAHRGGRGTADPTSSGSSACSSTTSEREARAQRQPAALPSLDAAAPRFPPNCAPWRRPARMRTDSNTARRPRTHESRGAGADTPPGTSTAITCLGRSPDCRPSAGTYLTYAGAYALVCNHRDTRGSPRPRGQHDIYVHARSPGREAPSTSTVHPAPRLRTQTRPATAHAAPVTGPAKTRSRRRSRPLAFLRPDAEQRTARVTSRIHTSRTRRRSGTREAAAAPLPRPLTRGASLEHELHRLRRHQT